jgi:hypothetical protein
LSPALFASGVAVALAVQLATAGSAKAEGPAQSYAATDYWLNYETHAHNYADDVPLVPRFTDNSQWSRIREALMGSRKAHALYLVGDDHVHMFPTRVGVLGWGMSAGFVF